MLTLAFGIFQLSSLRRRSALVELQSLQDVTTHLKQALTVFAYDRGDPTA
jgi:hypothetical protein